MNRLLLIATILTTGLLTAHSEGLQETKISNDDIKITGTNSDGKIIGEQWIQNGDSLVRLSFTQDILPEEPDETNFFASQSALQLILHTSEKGTNWDHVKGFHGRMYFAKNWRTPQITQTNLVEILSSGDKTKIVMMVWDNGPIYSTTNSGLTWRTISAPGSYDFPLTIGADGTGFSASATIHPVATKVTAAMGDWYATSQGANGSQLILTGNTSQAAPVLTIFPTNNEVIISWFGDLPNYILQANSDLATTNWNEVTNSALKVQNEYQVVIPSSEKQRFYRLKSMQAN